jgi:hypothetical protein
MIELSQSLELNIGSLRTLGVQIGVTKVTSNSKEERICVELLFVPLTQMLKMLEKEDQEND